MITDCGLVLSTRNKILLDRTNKIIENVKFFKKIDGCFRFFVTIEIFSKGFSPSHLLFI
jgi:hypothetical protein